MDSRRLWGPSATDQRPAVTRGCLTRMSLLTVSEGRQSFGAAGRCCLCITVPAGRAACEEVLGLWGAGNDVLGMGDRQHGS